MVLVLGSFALAAPASAERLWNEPDELTAKPVWPSFAMADDAALAVWAEANGPPIEAYVGSPGEGPVRQRLDDGGFNPDVAAGRDGFGVAAWSTPGYRLGLALRQPGQPFGDPGLVPSGAAPSHPTFPKVGVNATGRAAISAAEARGNRQWIAVSLRSPGGEFGPLRQVSPDFASQPAYERATAVTSDGRVVIAWTQYTSRPFWSDLRVVTVAADGTASPVQVLSDPEKSAVQPEIAVDGRGRAVVLWQERRRPQPNADGTYSTGVNGTLKAASLDRSPALSEPFVVPGAEARTDYGRVGMTAEGEVTFAFTRSESDIRIGVPHVVTGPLGGPYTRPYPVAGYYGADEIELAVGPDGQALVSWRLFGFPSTPEVARRSASGRWQSPQDLRLPCGPGGFASGLEVSPDGRGGAFLFTAIDSAYRYEVTTDYDSLLPGTRLCGRPTSSFSNPYPDPPPGGDPVIPPVSPGALPDVVGGATGDSSGDDAPRLDGAPPGLTMRGPALRGRRVALRVGCDEACSLKVRLRMRRTGRRLRVVATGSRTFSGPSLRRVSLPISRRARAAIRRRGSRLSLVLTARDVSGNTSRLARRARLPR